ncbi:uncharacterized protein LOC124362681 [Homalodisca vitripennis]|uniref:uncharacterized protein LOC124362681 n=1 Tax=Homalodisca vitripennis TaxID=197043 RepID=UPI001EEB2625|nr:uncharacterized protein LOC124362681 [Homalodisca vitripennis]
MDRAKPGSFKKRLTRVLSLGGIEPPTLPPSPVRKINGKLRPMSDGGVQGATFYLPSPVTSPTRMTSPNTSPQNKPAPTSSLPLGKWQLMIRETTVPSSQLVGWTRVWRLARLLLDTGC